MSALLEEDGPRRPRAMRFARPVADPEPAIVRPRARPSYSPDSPAVPVPPALRRYVRGPAHFALVLGALTGHAGGEDGRGYKGDRLECAQRCLALLAGRRPNADGRPHGLADPLAAELLLLLFPPVPCGVCGEGFLRENGRRDYCSDGCRRRAAVAAAKARSAASPAGTEGTGGEKV